MFFLELNAILTNLAPASIYQQTSGTEDSEDKY